jgi:hypothetical protein
LFVGESETQQIISCLGGDDRAVGVDQHLSPLLHDFRTLKA